MLISCNLVVSYPAAIQIQKIEISPLYSVEEARVSLASLFSVSGYRTARIYASTSLCSFGVGETAVATIALREYREQENLNRC